MKAIVLGAGKGKRLHSEEFEQPKVMREANGKPLIRYMLDSISFIAEHDTVIVVGYKKEYVMENIKGDFKFAVQEEQLGTGHAVNSAKELFKDYDGNVLITYGDMPLFREETFKGMIEMHDKTKADCTVLTANIDRHIAFGRIVRDANGKFADVVEQKDCNEEQDKIREYNAGIYIFNSKKLFKYLSELKNDNAQGEYYLTDVPRLMLKDSLKIETYSINDEKEIMGVNTPEDLKEVEEILIKKNKKSV